MFRDPFDPFGGWGRPPRDPRVQAPPPPRRPSSPPPDPWSSPLRRAEPRSERPEPLPPVRRFRDESPFYRDRMQPPVRRAAPAEPPGAWEREQDEHARAEERPSHPVESPRPEAQQAHAPRADERPVVIATNHAELALRRATEELEAQKRRMEREQQRTLEETRAQVAAEMLPVLDNLDRSIAAASTRTEAEAQAEAPLLEGIRLVRAQFEEALGRVGLTRIESEGHRFDPAVHDAVGLVEVDDASKDGTVVDEWQRGYRLGERVIRPAKVRVAKRTVS